MDSLRAQEPSGWVHKIIIVDNSGANAIGGIVGTDVQVIRPMRNKGFAAGCNIGIQYALVHRAQWVLLLNNDIILDPDVLRQLWRGCVQCPSAEVLGGKVLYHGDPARIWFAGGTIREEVLQTRHIGIDKLDATWSDTPRLVAFVTGTLMLVRTLAFAKIGLLDEAYFLYCEDTDFCRRVRAAGGEIMYLPAVRCRHEVGAGRPDALQPHYLYYATRNRFRLFSKGKGPLRRIYVRIIGTVIFGIVRGILLLRDRSGRRTTLLRALVLGWWDGVRGRTGKLVDPGWS